MSIPTWLYKERYDLQQKVNRTEDEEKQLHEMLEWEKRLIEEQDECWRSMMAMRTPEEIARGVVAPG